MVSEPIANGAGSTQSVNINNKQTTTKSTTNIVHTNGKPGNKVNSSNVTNLHQYWWYVWQSNKCWSLQLGLMGVNHENTTKGSADTKLSTYEVW